jgi:hypothetical protein
LLSLIFGVKQFWPQNCLGPDLSGAFQDKSFPSWLASRELKSVWTDF